MSAYAQQRADQAKSEAINAQSIAGAKMAPQGTVYDVATNNYKDPLTGNVYVGAANTTAQGPGGITQQMGVNPQPGLGGLRFQQGAAGVTPNIPVAPPLPENQKQFIDQRMVLDGQLAGASNPGTVSSGTARSEQGVVGSEINQTKSSLDTFYQGLMDKLDGRNQQNVDLLKQQQQSAEQGLRGAQAQETNTKKALEYRLGRSDTLYGNSEMQQLAASHRQEIADSNMKYQTAIQNANNALQDGQISLAKEWRAQAIQEQQLAMQKEDRFNKIQELSRKDTSSTIENMAKSGFNPGDKFFSEQDQKNGWADGASKAMWAANKQDQDIKLAKDAIEVENLRVTQRKAIADIIGKTKVGEEVVIGGVSYGKGTDMSGLQQGTETNTDGVVTHWTYDPATGETVTTRIGAIGKAQDGWETQKDDQGRLWSVDAKSGVMKPIFPSAAQTSWQKDFPEGSVWMRDGKPAPQCGQFVNDLTGAGVGDSFESKMAKCDKTISPGGDNPPQIGDFFVQKLGTQTGHIGLVAGVETGPDGKQYITALESNYPQKGKITSTRVFPADQVNGFGRTGKYPEQLAAGPDSPTFGLKGQDDKVLSPAELSAIGLDPATNYGTTQSQATRLIAGKAGNPTPLDIPFEDFKSQEEVKRGMSLKPEDVQQEYNYQRNILRAVDAVANKQKSSGQRYTLKNDLLDLYRQGDLSAVEDRLKAEGRGLLAGAAGESYDARDNAIQAWNHAANLLAPGKVETGPLKAIVEEKKPWGKVKADPAYTDLKDWVELGQAQIRKSFYGTAVTDTEAKTGNNFLISDKDLPSTIAIKIKNGAAYMQFVNDLTIAKQVGTERPKLEDYIK